jgi:hypothetical protein
LASTGSSPLFAFSLCSWASALFSHYSNPSGICDCNHWSVTPKLMMLTSVSLLWASNWNLPLPIGPCDFLQSLHSQHLEYQTSSLNSVQKKAPWLHLHPGLSLPWCVLGFCTWSQLNKNDWKSIQPDELTGIGLILP